MQSTAMKTSSVIAGEYMREIEAEVRATRECLENVPTDKYDWKPHEKSMNLGYLAQLVADIPRWLQYAIEESVIDFETYPQFKGTTNEELVAHLTKSVEGAKKALTSVTDEKLKETFQLKRGETVLMSTPIDETISSSINHMVHHRGQLTVYLRLLDIPIPSIYGPSADSGGF